MRPDEHRADDNRKEQGSGKYRTSAIRARPVGASNVTFRPQRVVTAGPPKRCSADQASNGK
jgi:hypothetical protein